MTLSEGLLRHAAPSGHWIQGSTGCIARDEVLISRGANEKIESRPRNNANGEGERQ